MTDRPRFNDHGFPVRVGALDVGSNAIRFVTAEFRDPNTYRQLDLQRFAIRLGHDTFTTGALQPRSIEAVLQASRRFRARIDELGVIRYRAVATSAVRECRNGALLVDMVGRDCGVHLETISGTEEARLVWVAVSRRVPLGDRPFVLVDLGGGSMEISIVDRQGIRMTESHPLGAVRLVERFQASAGNPSALQALILESLADLALPSAEGGHPVGVIATGGNAEVIADLVGSTPDAAGVSAITRGEMARTLEILLAMSLPERIERLGLRKDRADVIVPALILFDRIAELAGCDRVLVPRVGLKDGIIYELATEIANRQHDGIGPATAP